MKGIEAIPIKRFVTTLILVCIVVQTAVPIIAQERSIHTPAAGSSAEPATTLGGQQATVTYRKQNGQWYKVVTQQSKTAGPIEDVTPVAEQDVPEHFRNPSLQMCHMIVERMRQAWQQGLKGFMPLTPEETKIKADLMTKRLSDDLEKYKGKEWQLYLTWDGKYAVRPETQFSYEEMLRFAGPPIEKVVIRNLSLPLEINHREDRLDRFYSQFGGDMKRVIAEFQKLVPAGVTVREVTSDETANDISQSHGFNHYIGILPLRDKSKAVVKDSEGRTARGFPILGLYIDVTGQRIGFVNCVNLDCWEPTAPPPRITIDKQVKHESEPVSDFRRSVFAITGDIVDHRVIIHNPGPVVLNVRFEDTLPPGLEFQVGSVKLDGNLASSANPTAGINRLEPLGVGVSWVIEYQVKPTVTVIVSSIELENTAWVIAGPLREKSTAKVVVTLPVKLDFERAKAVKDPKTEAFVPEIRLRRREGQEVRATYRFEGTNTGNPVKLSQFRFTDKFPGGDAEGKFVPGTLRAEWRNGTQIPVEGDLTRGVRLLSEDQVQTNEKFYYFYDAMLTKPFGAIVNIGTLSLEKVPKSASAQVIIEGGPGDGQPRLCQCDYPDFAWGIVGLYYPRPSKADKVRWASLAFGSLLDKYEQDPALRKNINKYLKEYRNEPAVRNFWRHPTLRIRDQAGAERIIDLQEAFVQTLLGQTVKVYTLNDRDEVVTYDLKFNLGLNDKAQFVILLYNICTGKFIMMWYREGWHWTEFFVGAGIVGGAWILTASFGGAEELIKALVNRPGNVVFRPLVPRDEEKEGGKLVNLLPPPIRWIFRRGNKGNTHEEVREDFLTPYGPGQEPVGIDPNKARSAPEHKQRMMVVEKRDGYTKVKKN